MLIIFIILRSSGSKFPNSLTNCPIKQIDGESVSIMSISNVSDNVRPDARKFSSYRAICLIEYKYLYNRVFRILVCNDYFLILMLHRRLSSLGIVCNAIYTNSFMYGNL